jgi:ribosome maturation factor RimP
MSSARQRLVDLLEPAIESMGYELVDLEANLSGRHGVIRIYIDRLASGPPTPVPSSTAEGDGSGIGLDDCEAVSRQVSGILDVEDVVRAQYNLEVSSPGMDRKLVKPAHFDRFAGSEVTGRLRTMIDGRRKLSGVLRRREGEEIVVLVDGREINVPLANLELMRLVPRF